MSLLRPFWSYRPVVKTNALIPQAVLKQYSLNISSSTTPHHSLNATLKSTSTPSSHLNKPRTSIIPPGAWDSHMHLADPARYPLSAAATYTPSTHTLPEALAFESAHGIANVVLVQPSVYGTDNALVLDTLTHLGPHRARAVVAFDPDSLPPATLHAWHALGVRAARINISSVGKVLSADELESLLRKYAEVLRPLGWVLQLYLPMDMITLLEPIVPSLGVRICIDHIGNPTLPDLAPGETLDPYVIPGFASMARLLEQGSTYVKFSGPYRLSKRADYSDLEPLAREVLRLRGKDRVVFATDWPHTRCDNVNITPWIEKIREWCGEDQEMVEALFKTTAEELWG